MFNNASGKGGRSGGGSSSGSGRPIGNDGADKEKWLLLGAVGTVAVLASIAYFEMGYREIGWKEFTNK